MTDKERELKMYEFTQELQSEFNSRVYDLLGEMIDEISYQYGIERNYGLEATDLVDVDTELTVNEDCFHFTEEDEENQND